MARRRACAGQAAVELVAALPALVLAAALAAEAGALAGTAGRDAKRAALEALPGWARERSHVSADGGRVKVELRPPAPLAAIAKALTVSSEAWSRSPRGGG